MRAYVAEIDRMCPSVILGHGQAGQFVFRAAQVRPDKVRALVAVAPSGFGEPDKAAVLKGIPTLVVYGDYIEADPRWPTIRRNGLNWVKAQQDAGGSVEMVHLPERGMRGNSQMMMMERNNLEVAALIQDWLRGKGLAR